MPINLVAKAAGNAGVVSPTLGDAAVNFDGTFVNPASIAGSINANLGQSAADFVGLFTQFPNRTGTIGSTLSNFPALFGFELTAPENLVLSNQSANSIQLDWDTVTGADSYEVQKSTTSASTGFSVINAPTEPYDLSGFSIPFAVNWPNEPNTTNSVTVSNISDLQTFASAGGYAITVNAGTYTGAVNIASDTDIIMSNSATVFGDVTASGNSRIRWTGGNYVATGGQGIVATNTNDLMFNNINLTAGSRNSWNFSGFNRLSFINCSFSSVGIGGTNNGWFIYTLETGPYSDIIVANCKFATGAGRQTVRVQATTRMIYVDSYFNVGNVGSNSIRTHKGTGPIYWDNLIAGSGVQFSDTPGDFGAIGGEIRNTSIYQGGPQFVTEDIVQDVTVYDSITHSTNGDGPAQITGGFIDGGGNTRVAWNGLASGMPDGVGIGADH